MDAVGLISKGDPIGSGVVHPSKQLQLATSGREALQQAIDLVRLVRRLPHFGDQHICVQTAAVPAGAALDADQAMFFPVIYPVP